MYVCQVNVCQVKLKLLAVKGAVSSRSYISSEALEFGKLATSCTDWVWPPGGAAVLGKPCRILWDHRDQRADRDLHRKIVQTWSSLRISSSS